MTLTRCSNGHFYDQDKFDQCPHCGTAKQINETVAMNRDNNQTVALSHDAASGASTSLKDAVAQAVTSATASVDGNVTQSYYNRAIGTEPVVGWLVCVEGTHLGEDFRLKSGRNSIGRATGMDVPLTGDNTVSREKHAFVVYDPENQQFLALPGDARELCYLNDKLVLSAMELKINDVLKVGATKLMFFPCCTEAFHWNMVSKDKETNK